MSRCNECGGTGRRSILTDPYPSLGLRRRSIYISCSYCDGTGDTEIVMSKYGTAGGETKPPICDVCGRALIVGLHAPTICQSCAKYGPEYLHAAVTPTPTCLKYDCDKPLIHEKGGVWRCEDGHAAWTFASPDEIAEAGKSKKGATSAEPESTPNVAWVKSVLQDCCRNKDISRETAKEIVTALLRDTGGIDFDHSAVTNRRKPICDEGGGEEFAVALLLQIAEELDEYGSERAAQHLRRHAKKLKEKASD